MNSPPQTPRALILTNLGLARFVARRCIARFGRIIEPDDLVQEAHLGLVRAATHYDPTRGVRFTTYAFRCCWRACLDAVRSAQARRATASRQVKPLKATANWEDRPSRDAAPTDLAAAHEIWTRAMSLLGERERKLLRQRFEQGRSYRELACLNGCGRAQMARMERAALARIRAGL